MHKFKPYTKVQLLNALGRDILSKPQLEKAIFYPDPKLFTPITDTKNIWLEKYPGVKGQPYDDFMIFTTPTQIKSTVYIMPFGEFKEDAPNLDNLLEYCKSFFFKSLRFELHRTLPLVELTGYETSLQTVLDKTNNYYINDLAKIIKNEMDAECVNTYAVIGVTMEGLEPVSEYDCMHDHTVLRHIIGLVSFKKYANELKEKNPKDYDILINKIGCNLITHETMHTMGLHHCPYFHCNMNPAISLDTILRRPLHICPICLRKLGRIFPSMDLIQRYQSLLEFYQSNKFEEEAEWTEKMLKNIEKNFSFSPDIIQKMYENVEKDV